MRGLLRHWTKSSIIPSQKDNQSGGTKPRKRTVSFAEDRLLTWSMSTSGSQEPTMLSTIMPTYSLLVFEMMIFRNSIQSGTEFYCLWQKSRLMTSWKDSTNSETSVWETQDRIGMYDLEIHQKKIGPDYHRLKTMAKRSIEQNLRNKNFGARSGNFEKNAVVKNQGTKQRVQRILGDCWQWETNGQCVKGDNCSFRHDMNKRGRSSPPNPSPNSFMRQNERKSSTTRSPRGKSPSGRMSRWPCKVYLRETCNNSFCEKWHPPECLFYKTKICCRFVGKVLICTSSGWRTADDKV